MSSESQLLVANVCKVSDMKNGEMREIDFGDDNKALLIKEDDKFSAVGALCTHHKAPLIKGAYYKGRIRCPWHGACFNAKTGDIEDYPGLDSLHAFEVSIEGDEVLVKAHKDNVKNFKRQKRMSCRLLDNKESIVIIGSGGAGLTCAESLRQQSYTGKITVVSKDRHLPYDRTKLSKNLSLGVDSILLRNQQFFKDNGIDMVLSTSVVKLDTAAKTIILDNEEKLSYSKLLLAPGSPPRTLPIPGWDLKHVFVLRSADDAASIINAATGKNAVVIGASFIGMEAASSLVSKAASVTVCEYFRAPYQSVLGVDVGKVFQNMHEERGIKMKMNVSVTELKGEQGVVKQVVLNDGTTIEADVVVAGVGVQPATEFLSKSGIEMDKRGFVKVNKYLQTNVENVYAAGDIALFPLKMRNWELVNIQHWQMAHFHGNLIGRNMVKGNTIEASSVPFFWSNLAPGKNVRYVGCGYGYDDIVVTGSLSERKFCAFYCKGDEVVAAATFMMDPKASEIAEKWHSGEKILKKSIC